MARSPAIDRQELIELPEGAEDTSGFFDYRPLQDDGSTPPDVTARYRLARRYRDEEEGSERLRLVLLTGYDVNADALDCVVYIWRADSEDVIWARERWTTPKNVLPLYHRDASFSPESAERLHEQYRRRGDASVADQAREILGG